MAWKRSSVRSRPGPPNLSVESVQVKAPAQRSHQLGIESAEQRCFPQFLIGSKKNARLRSIFAPLQSRSQLKRVSRAQVVAIHELYCLRAQDVRGLNHRPRSGKPFGKVTSLGPFAGVKLLHPQKSGKGACNLDRRSPPDRGVVDFMKCDSPWRNGLLYTERNQCASIPEGESPHLAAFPFFPPYPFHGFVGNLTGRLRP